MSYLRFGWDLRYVAGESGDYIIHDYQKGIINYRKEGENTLSDSGLVELCCCAIYEKWGKDMEFVKWLTGRLSERLNVKLRKTPLSIESMISNMNKKSKSMKI